MRRLIPVLVLLVVAVAGVVLLAPQPEGDITLGGSHMVTRAAPSGAGALRLEVGSAVANAAAAMVDIPEPPLTMSPVEQVLLDLANADRKKHGLQPFAFDEQALAVARARARQQLDLPALTHFDAMGEMVFLGLLNRLGVDYSLAGENLARSKGTDPSTLQRMEEALMNSPTHRRNLLDPVFTRLGIGAATDPSGRLAFAQIFLS